MVLDERALRGDVTYGEEHLGFWAADTSSHAQVALGLCQSGQGCTGLDEFRAARRQLGTGMLLVSSITWVVLIRCRQVVRANA